MSLDDSYQEALRFLKETPNKRTTRVKRKLITHYLETKKPFECHYCKIVLTFEKCIVGRLIRELPENFATIEHLIPISRFLTNKNSQAKRVSDSEWNGLDNIVFACALCNNIKGNKDGSQILKIKREAEELKSKAWAPSKTRCVAVYAETGNLEPVTGEPVPRSWKTTCGDVTLGPYGNFCPNCGDCRRVEGSPEDAAKIWDPLGENP